MPEQSSQISPSDRGALCGLTSTTVRTALQIGRQGTVYDLGVELGNQVSQPSPGRAAPFTYQREFFGDPDGRGIQFCSEVAEGHLHHGTHIDALVHVQREETIYGGHTASSMQNDAGWTNFGTETIPPIVCRGVLIDLAVAAPLPDGYAVGPEEIAAAVQAQRVELKMGDAVLLRTGKIAQFAADPAGAWNACPGISSAAARWLAEQGMALLGMDTASPDPLPITQWTDLVHEELLLRRGIHIVENLYLEDLAHDSVIECLFICSPLKIQGATGAWVRPIALV